jgi:putative hydrolase of the HAD superfamily
MKYSFFNKIVFTASLLFSFLFILPNNFKCARDGRLVNHGNNVVAPVKTVIFDFNGVLFEISRSAVMRYLKSQVFAYGALWKNSEKGIDRMFGFLCSVDGEALVKVSPKDVLNVYQPMHKHWVLPNIMQQWMLGNATSQEVIDRVERAIDLDENKFFVTTNTWYSPLFSEKELCKKMIQVFFNPGVRLKLYRPIQEGVDLLKQCKERGFYTLLLSNIDGDIIPLLEEKHPEVFKLFDDTVLSADVGMLKPDPAIYEYVLEKYNLNPEETYFLDDEPINVESAREFGIRAFVFNPKETSSVAFCEQISPLGLMAA